MVEHSSSHRQILLVEDEPTLASLLSERLEKEGYSVSVAHDGEQGLALALPGHFDLILVDVKLPKRNGVDVCRILRRHGLNVPVVMLTARGDVKDRVKGLKAGADDYLVKPFDVAELLARMDAIFRRLHNAPAQSMDRVFEFGDVVVNMDKEEILRIGEPVVLTAREFALLRYFILHPNERLSREVLLKEVWGYRHSLNTRTLDLHVSQLRRKLEEDPQNPRHILTQFRSGYRFVPFP